MNDALLACSVGDIAWLKRCLSSDCDLFTTNKDVSHSLLVAAALVTMLILRLQGLNCLHLAAKNSHLDCLIYLLNNFSITVDEAVPSSGCTALHFSISTKSGSVKSLQCMKLLLERGADHNKYVKNLYSDLQSNLWQCFRPNRDGQTALHIATRKGYTKCLQKLLEQGANIDLRVSVFVSSTYSHLIVFTLQDKDGRTAYDIAILHGQFECARLLRALHWATRKDKGLNSELQDRAERQKQEQEKRAIDARLRKEAAERAYTHWAHKKSKPTRQPPAACRERQERKSQSQTPQTCSSCKATGTRKSSAKPSNSKINSTMKVVMHQAKRNVESTGKPAKMHPYTNYPPRKQKRSSHIGKSSRTSTTASSPAPPSKCATLDIRKRNSVMSEVESLPPQSTTDGKDNCHIETSMSECPSSSELNLSFLRRSASYPGIEADTNENKVHFLVGGMDDTEVEEGDGEYDEDEDIAFHDVSKADSLSSLPVVLTKDRTPAEIIKLLRDLGSNKSSSGSHSRNLRHRRLSYQRRFSLGAIPEGQIVTNYSNESMVSLDELSTRPRLMDLSPRGSTAWEEEDEVDDQLQQTQDEGDTLWTSNPFELVEVHDGREDHEEECTEVGSASGAVGSKKPLQLQALNIVNFAWDTTSNSVQTNVTKSPMIPANHSWPSTTVSTLPRSSSPSPPPSPSYQNTLATSPNLNRRLTPKSKHVSSTTGKVKILEAKTSSLKSASSPSTELESTHTTEHSDWGLTLPLITQNDSCSGLASPDSPPTTPLPAHSLFGGMGGLGSKSMISFVTPTPVNSGNDHEASTVYHTEPSQQPKMKRRIKSAPNMSSLQQQATETQPLKTSLFTFGGRLQQ